MDEVDRLVLPGRSSAGGGMQARYWWLAKTAGSRVLRRGNKRTSARAAGNPMQKGCLK